MLFPKFHIDEIKKQEGRDLTRFDLDFDLPDHFLPEFPPPIYLTTRPDLGDVSQGKLVTHRQLLRAVQRHPQPQAARGAAAAGHAVPAAAVQRDRGPPQRAAAAAASPASTATSTATPTAPTHLVGDIRPQEFRHRIETPSLRGVNIQRLFGSQRALKTRRGLHRVRAARRLLRRRSRDRHQEGRERPRARQPGPLHGRVPGAARLPAGARSSAIDGKLDPKKATEAEMRGQELFFGKAKCAHLPPAAVLHRQPDAQPARPSASTSRRLINGMTAVGDGPIKTFPLRGIKDSPAVPARRPAADARGHGRVLQPRPRAQAHRPGEEGPRRVHAAALKPDASSPPPRR